MSLDDGFFPVDVHEFTPVAALSLTIDWNIFSGLRAFISGTCRYGWQYKSTGAWRTGASVGIYCLFQNSGR